MDKKEKLYAERDVEDQGDFYFDHVMAMTAEGLHSKSAIAAELAHRDIVIDNQSKRIIELEASLNWSATPFEV